MAETAIARRTFSSGRRGTIVWTALFAFGVVATLAAYATAYPDEASRAVLTGPLANNAGLAAILGPAYDLSTPGGFLAWRISVPLALLVSIWMVLAMTRALRGEEDAGHWDLVVSGSTTARRATLAAIAGVAGSAAVTFVVVAAITLGLGPRYGLPATDSLLFVSAIVVAGLSFGAIGALCAQLVESRRAAAGLAGAVVGLAFAMRAVSDVLGPLRAWRWASPIGWVPEVRAFTGNRPLAIVGLLAVAAAASALAVVLAGRRDVGDGILSVRASVLPSSALLGSSFQAALRAAVPGAIGWSAAFGAYALVFASLARSVTDAIAESGFDELFERLGIGDILEGPGYLAFALFFVMSIVASALAASHVSAIAEDEETGLLDRVLACPVPRRRLLFERTAAAALSVVALVSIATLLGITAVVATGSRIPVARLVVSGLATIPVAVVFLGVGILVYGLRPRLAGPVAYAAIGLAAGLQLVGRVAVLPAWVAGLSPYFHLAPSPAVDVNTTASIVMLIAGMAAAVTGVEAFARRDVAVG